MDVFVAECDPATGVILPGYPVNATAQIGLPGSSGNTHDKEWLAVDAHAGSPFADRLYLAWTRFPPSGDEVTLTSHSSDHGLTWSTPVSLGVGTGSSFLWPAHVTTAPNGDVYVVHHRQPAFSGGAPNGISGLVECFRSTDGGVTFPQQSQPFTAGEADMTFNVQSAAAPIPGARFLLVGSVQPWVLADPNVAGRIYVVANDDPDNAVQSGDAANVYLARSDDYGANWNAPVHVDHGPGTTFQVMATAGIDPVTGAIAVQYYDNRNGEVNAQGDYLLDVYVTVSLDGGVTFEPDVKLNDVPFDPDAGARCRYDCGPFFTDAWAAGGGKAFVVSNTGYLLEYKGGGVWSIAAASGVPLSSVWGSSETDVFACGFGGKIYHYNGVSAVSQPSGTGLDLMGMDGRSGTDVYAVGPSGTVLHYNGSAWSPLSPPTVQELHDVWANPGGSIFVVGRGGTVLRYDGTWTDLSIGSGDDLFGVWGSGDSDVYVSGINGGFYHWDGSLWTPVDLGLPYLGEAWGSSATDVIVLGWGRLRRYDGISWSADDPSEQLLWKLDGSGPGDVFAVGEDAEVVHFDGSGWTRLNNPLMPSNPTNRIGEYIGIAAGGNRVDAVWCGNTGAGVTPVNQQAIFHGFRTDWQVGVSLLDPMDRSPNLRLDPPSPNPARRSLAVAYSLPRSATVDLALLDVQGRRVATLIDGLQPAGRHVVSWVRRGEGPAPGVYLMRLTDGRASETRRVILLQ